MRLYRIELSRRSKVNMMSAILYGRLVAMILTFLCGRISDPLRCRFLVLTGYAQQKKISKVEGWDLTFETMSWKNN